jgi:hypothetical protein
MNVPAYFCFKNFERYVQEIIKKMDSTFLVENEVKKSIKNFKTLKQGYLAF